MFEEQNPEKKITELEIRNHKLDRDTLDLLKELKVTPEQLSLFLKESENFTKLDWEKMQNEREKIDQKLQTELKSFRNPLKSQKTQQERNINNHWLFVRWKRHW